MAATPEQDRELFELLEAVVNETITPAQHARLEELLAGDPAAQDRYLAHVDLHLGLRKLVPAQGEVDPLADLAAREACQPCEEPATTDELRVPNLFRLGLVFSITALLGAIVFKIWFADLDPAKPEVAQPAGPPAVQPAQPGGPEHVAENIADPLPPVPAPPLKPPVLAQAQARFFGEVSALTAGSVLELRHPYALAEGLVQLRFDSGAEAIIEAPAVFEIPEANRLAIQVGKCSILAPDGAQGFQVLTPLARVVDRGTRFSVDVDESGELDVQVVDGAAEVFAGKSRDAVVVDGQQQAEPVDGGVELRTGQARRYDVKGNVIGENGFDANRYRHALPDRVMAYETTLPGGRADELTSLTVQRGGVPYRYEADQLIGIDVIHFKGRDSGANITTPLAVVDERKGNAERFRRTDLLDRDRSLITGVINPGGSRCPFSSNPVMNDPEDPAHPNTPGFGIRFHEPVVNGPGPDVVFFDLHVIVHPEAGDPFHVGPLEFRPGLKTKTVRTYDMDLNSPDARLLGRFRLYKFEARTDSLSELLAGRHNGGTEHVVGAKALVVGIDLSDLGYEEGARVEGLFFQDVLDDSNFIDPVFIGGLPPVEAAATK